MQRFPAPQPGRDSEHHITPGSLDFDDETAVRVVPNVIHGPATTYSDLAPGSGSHPTAVPQASGSGIFPAGAPQAPDSWTGQPPDSRVERRVPAPPGSVTALRAVHVNIAGVIMDIATGLAKAYEDQFARSKKRPPGAWEFVNRSTEDIANNLRSKVPGIEDTAVSTAIREIGFGAVRRIQDLDI